jgi:hypothetical protein
MNPTRLGWITFIGAMGMMMSLIALDIGKLNTWQEATSPKFTAEIFGKISVVIASFIGGRIMPTKSKR